MAVKTFGSEVLSSSDVNTYLANSGLVYVTSADLGGATTVTISNCFTSAYRDYRVIIAGQSNNGSAFDMTIQFTVGGTPNGSNSYVSNIMFNTHVGGPSRSYTGLTTTGYCGITANPTFSNAIDIYAPQTAFYTSWSGMGNGFGSTTAVIGQWYGNFNGTTQFDGLQITAQGQTMTGTITIMGYRKA